MSWAAELLQITQQCATTTSESPPLRVLTRWSPASAQLPVWNLMQALALMHWLRSCWLAAVGLPPEDKAAGEALAAGMRSRDEMGVPMRERRVTHWKNLKKLPMDAGRKTIESSARRQKASLQSTKVPRREPS